MSPSQIKDLIQFHRDALRQHHHFMESSAIYLVCQTILALEAYLCIVEGKK